MIEIEGTSVLAFATTVHCALLILLRHRMRARGGTALVLLPSIAAVVSPWFLAEPGWLVTIFIAHVTWFTACDRMVGGVKGVTTARSGSSAATPPQRTAAPVATRGGSEFERVPVLAVFSETPEIRTFRFSRPEGFDFKPGQFVIVKVEIDDRPAVRCYSISSSPSSTGYLEISVRKQGKVSGLLHATVTPGSMINVKGPGGVFVWPKGPRPIVLIAAGIGITPLLSMLRWGVENEPLRPITLIFSARAEEHAPFLDDLRLLGRRHPNFRLAVSLSRGATRPEFHSGRIDPSLIRTVVDYIEESIYLICGPGPMIESMKAILEDLGVPQDQVDYEKFEAAVASATSPTTRQIAQAVTLSPNGISVRMQARGVLIPLRRGQSILEAATSAGEELPSMCGVGVCGTCRVRLIEGEVDGEFDLLDEGDRAAGEILACVARPRSDCVIDA